MNGYRFHELFALRASTPAFQGLCSGLAFSKVLAPRRNLQEKRSAFLQAPVHEA